MGRKFLLEILWISAQNKGFTNTKSTTNGLVEFSNWWIITRDASLFKFQNFEDRGNPIDTIVDISTPITVDKANVVKQFLFDEFRLDGEKK